MERSACRGTGLVYGRVGSDFFCGTEIPRAAIGRSGGGLPEPDADAVTRIAALFAARPRIPHGTLPDSLWHSFLRDSAAVFGLGDAEVGDCSLRDVSCSMPTNCASTPPAAWGICWSVHARSP